MMKRILGPIVLVMCMTLVVFAQDAPQSDDQRAVLSAIEGYVKAFNTQDATKLASYWEENGDYIDQRGRMVKGQESILAEYDAFFKTFEKPTMTINVASLDFANENVVIEDGVREVQFPENQPTREIRYTAVHVKKDGKWLVHSVRDAVLFKESNYDYLRGLEWMVGEWLDEEADGVVIQTSCDWSPNRNFMIRNFLYTDLFARPPKDLFITLDGNTFHFIGCLVNRVRMIPPNRVEGPFSRMGRQTQKQASHRYDR